MAACSALCTNPLHARREAPLGRPRYARKWVLLHRSPGIGRNTLCAASSSGGDRPTDDRLLAAAKRDPVSFLGGMFAGFLALDVNQGEQAQRS